MLLHEQAYDLASRGLTNIEIFGTLELTPAMVMRVAVSDSPLLFAVLKGRVAYLTPFLLLLEEEAREMVTTGSPTRNFRALEKLIERYDRENNAIGVGYDLAVLASAPAPSDGRLRGAELTKALRSAA